MEVIATNYLALFPLISILLVGSGIFLKRYLSKVGPKETKEILVVGTGVFVIRFLANALIVIGFFFFLTACAAFYFYLEYEGLI